LQGNRDFVCDFVEKHLPAIKVIPAQGTYLLWLDCRGLELSDVQLRDFFVYQAKVGMNPGTVFGKNGSGFMRLNIGSPRQVLADALQRIKHAVVQY
jgi:cystathionine beta-lyase